MTLSVALWACQPTTDPGWPNQDASAAVMPCGLESPCTAEQLEAWLQAELERTTLQAQASVAEYELAMREWRGELLFSGDTIPSSLLQCEPQPYQADVTIIGSAGGTVAFGPHQLVIPAGAVSNTVVISGEIVIDTHVLTNFEPHGLTFAVPASLDLAFDNCLAAVDSDSVRTAYVDDNLNILEYPVSSVTTEPDYDGDGFVSGTVSAEIEHFSKYAVAF